MSNILVTTPGDVTVEVAYNPVAGAGGDTNIGVTRTATDVVVTSSSGTDGTILAADGSNAGVFTSANYAKLAAITGTNTGDQFIFKNVAVSGQSTVTAETTNDTLTLVAGTNVTITTDAGTDSVTINASGGGGSGDVVGPASATDNAVALYDGTTGKLLKNGVVLGTAATTASTAYTASTVVPSTAPSAGQVLVGNAGGTAYAPVSASGDATLASTGAVTLATVNSNVGSFGGATAGAVITVDAKGRITAASAVTVTPAVGSITGLGTGVSTALGVNVGSAGALVVNGGALGTPSSGTLTNCTGLPVSGIAASTSTALGVGSLELGHASDTTLARSSAGDVAVEGNRLYRVGGSMVGLPVEFSVALGDETTDATTGLKVTWRAPCAMSDVTVRFEAGTAPTGSVAILDVKEAGSTIFSTKPQIAISATTSVGGAVPGTVSDSSIADNAVITFHLDQIGSTIAGAGYKATIIGKRA